MPTLADSLAVVAFCTINDDALFPLEIERYFGIHGEGENSTNIYNAWSTLMKFGLITHDELVNALHEKQVAKLFGDKCKEFSQDQLPRCPKLPYCCAINDGVMTTSTFATDYNPNQEVPGPLPINEARLSADDSFKALVKEREAANEVFKSKNYKKAIEAYEEVLRGYGGAPFAIEIWNPVSLCLSNISQCHLYLENWNEARKAAKEALGFNPENEKAKFRKTEAEQQLMARLGKIERDGKAEAAKEYCQQQ